LVTCDNNKQPVLGEQFSSTPSAAPYPAPLSRSGSFVLQISLQDVADVIVSTPVFTDGQLARCLDHAGPSRGNPGFPPLSRGDSGRQISGSRSISPAATSPRWTAHRAAEEFTLPDPGHARRTGGMIGSAQGEASADRES
jgi:hypothetical protein